MNSRPPWRWRVSLLVVLAAVGALAQDRPPWFTRAWQSDVGLPDNTVVGIEQSPDGFLWVATPVGLVRFDGVQFRPFAPETAAGGPAGLIQALLVDRRGRIWVAKERGTVICVDQGRTTAVFTPEKGRPNPEARMLVEDSAGAVWVSYAATMRSMDGSDRFYPGAEHVPLMADPPVAENVPKVPGTVTPLRQGFAGQVAGQVAGQAGSAPSKVIMQMAAYVGGKVVRLQDGQARIFTVADGLPGGGTCQLANDQRGQLWFSQGKWVGVFRDDKFRPLTEFTAQCIAGARGGGVWLCAGKQLWKYTEGGSPVKIGDLPTMLSDVTPTVLHEDRSGIFLWIGTREAGLFRYAGNLVKMTEHQHILSVNSDRQGNVWIGTRGGGLNQLKPKAVELLAPANPIEFLPVRSLCQDKSDTRWIVTQDGVVWRSWGGGWVPLFHDGWTLPNAQCVAADPQGGVWIGTQTQGLHLWQNDKVTASLSKTNGLAGDSVSALLATPSGEVWLGAGSDDGQQHALQRRQGEQLRTFDLPSGSGPITALAVDAAGDCWAATAGGLLLRVRQDVLTDETKNTLAEPNAIRCLCATPDGSLWIGYAGAGVGRLNAGRFSRCRTDQGLYDDYISQILPDERGRLWFAGNRGIFSVRQKELDELAAGRAARVRSVAYGLNDGLPRLQASHDFWPSALHTKYNHLLFAMESGLADVYAAELFEKNLEPPSVVIERVTVNGRLVAAYWAGESRPAAQVPAPIELCGGAAHVRLAPSQRQVEFVFTALNFVKPENIGFKYWLHGLDKDWIEADTRRSASYPRIPPGDYRFQVIACNSDGVWNETGAALTLTVAPYWWEMTRFRVAGLLAAMGLLGGGVLWWVRRRYRHKIERLEMRQATDRERARIAQDLHDDLGAGLTEIGLLGDLAATRAPDAPETARQISRQARALVGALDEIVWAVNPRHDNSSALAAYFCRFAQDFLRPAGLACRLDVAEPLPAGAFTSTTRHQLFLAFKEALHNIVQHARASEVHLRIAAGQGQLVISLADNGRGFTGAAPAGSPDGLQGMRDRLTRLGGQCDIQSLAGGGVRVTFSLPLQAGPP